MDRKPILNKEEQLDLVPSMKIFGQLKPSLPPHRYCTAKFPNSTVKVNHFVSEDLQEYVPTFTESDICNCTTLYVRNFNSLQEFMGINVLNSSIHVLEANDISNLPSLRELSLSNTDLRRIWPDAFVNLPKLKYLYLEGNQLKRISNGVFNIPSVTLLTLRNNVIEEIEDNALENMTSLIELDLSNNRIVNIHSEWFMNLLKLERLDLSGNELRIVSNSTFGNLRNLQVLQLQNNKIQLLDKGSFKGLDDLKLLHLTDNRLKTIDPDVFMDLKDSLQELRICKNPLVCYSTRILLFLLKNLETIAVEEVDGCENRLTWSVLHFAGGLTLKTTKHRLKVFGRYVLRNLC
ncbi:hypothetical protein Trydic_g23587 [Trypoxylus dichotomus]